MFMLAFGPLSCPGSGTAWPEAPKLAAGEAPFSASTCPMFEASGPKKPLRVNQTLQILGTWTPLGSDASAGTIAMAAVARTGAESCEHLRGGYQEGQGPPASNIKSASTSSDVILMYLKRV